jgi:hypothetical protein
MVLQCSRPPPFHSHGDRDKFIEVAIAEPERPGATVRAAAVENADLDSETAPWSRRGRGRDKAQVSRGARIALPILAGELTFRTL